VETTGLLSSGVKRHPIVPTTWKLSLLWLASSVMFIGRGANEKMNIKKGPKEASGGFLVL
jgi:hypothetical protein